MTAAYARAMAAAAPTITITGAGGRLGCARLPRIAARRCSPCPAVSGGPGYRILEDLVIGDRARIDPSVAEPGEGRDTVRTLGAI